MQSILVILSHSVSDFGLVI